MHYIICKEIHEIKIGNIFIDSITNVYIIPAIVVSIKHQCAPTPIACYHTTVVCDLKKYYFCYLTEGSFS